jgi:hypothetical protein
MLPTQGVLILAWGRCLLDLIAVLRALFATRHVSLPGRHEALFARRAEVVAALLAEPSLRRAFGGIRTTVTRPCLLVAWTWVGTPSFIWLSFAPAG